MLTQISQTLCWFSIGVWWNIVALFCKAPHEYTRFTGRFQKQYASTGFTCRPPGWRFTLYHRRFFYEPAMIGYNYGLSWRVKMYLTRHDIPWLKPVASIYPPALTYSEFKCDHMHKSDNQSNGPDTKMSNPACISIVLNNLSPQTN